MNNGSLHNVILETWYGLHKGTMWLLIVEAVLLWSPNQGFLKKNTFFIVLDLETFFSFFPSVCIDFFESQHFNIFKYILEIWLHEASGSSMDISEFSAFMPYCVQCPLRLNYHENLRCFNMHVYNQYFIIHLLLWQIV